MNIRLSSKILIVILVFWGSIRLSFQSARFDHLGLAAKFAQGILVAIAILVCLVIISALLQKLWNHMTRNILVNFFVTVRTKHPDLLRAILLGFDYATWVTIDGEYLYLTIKTTDDGMENIRAHLMKQSGVKDVTHEVVKQ